MIAIKEKPKVCKCDCHTQTRAQCAKIVPATTYRGAHRCEKFANNGSAFCTAHRK